MVPMISLMDLTIDRAFMDLTIDRAFMDLTIDILCGYHLGFCDYISKKKSLSACILCETCFEQLFMCCIYILI